MKENPKNLLVHVRVDKITDNYLEELCENLYISRSELIRALIKEKYRDLFGEDVCDD